MDRKNSNPIAWAMDHRKIVILLTACLVAFGIYALTSINKNEFPDFTIRQGIVAAVYPGATVEEVEQQVTRPLEDYIFSMPEVKKHQTRSYSRDGMAIVQVELNDDISLTEKDAFWSRFKLGVQEFKATLPQGVLAIKVIDDFGSTSALLITLESGDKSYAEMQHYMDDLRDSLRIISSIGRMTVYGMQDEQVSVCLDNERLAHYGLSDKTIGADLLAKGLVTTGGTLRTGTVNSSIYVSRSLGSVADVGEMVVLGVGDNQVRLKDIADIRLEYPTGNSYITTGGVKTLLLGVEIKKGESITDMGHRIDRQLASFQKRLPDDVRIFKITDQAQVVGDSVSNFLLELLIAIGAVTLVVLLLLPLRVALTAAATIPISIFISLGLFHAVGLELNTVTLAALIVTLGMIVDNSIVIIDSYVEMLSEGVDRRTAALGSAQHFFKSILTATLAISITFFPLLLTIKGVMLDFIFSFPFAVGIVLLVSLVVAALLVPIMQYFFITPEYIARKSSSSRETSSTGPTSKSRKSFDFMSALQRWYDRVVDRCFRHRGVVIVVALLTIVAGAALMLKLPQQLMPTADRNQFAVELFLPTGTPVSRTVQVADSLERIIRRDPRVVSVTTFNGCSSPRFHTAYAPQFGGSNFAQMIVNTTGTKATVEVLDEMTERYANHFADARVKFLQLSYGGVDNPVEVRLSGPDWESIRQASSIVEAHMRRNPDFMLVRSNMDEPLLGTRVEIDRPMANRLGVNNTMLELTLALRYSGGLPVGSIWQGDGSELPVVIKSSHADHASPADLAAEPIPLHAGLAHAPLRQLAQVQPEWHDGCHPHYGGQPCATVMSEVRRGVNVMNLTARLQKEVAALDLPAGISVSYGGDVGKSDETLPQILTGLAISVLIIFFLLLFHYKRIRLAALLLVSLSLCLFGTACGVLIQGVNFGMTCYLGIISLMGILVRNAVIMYDYAGELHDHEHISYRDAIQLSAKRRIRPIFLTSAAASMGVIPMILGGTGLWMPMGAVICYGTLSTMLLILTVLPVAYSLIMREDG